MRVSIELVPRSEQQVHADALTVRGILPEANAFNIPDLTRFELRSWQACAIARQILPASIPHIRAIDIPPGDAIEVAETLLAANLSEVLVVRGDSCDDMHRRAYPHSSEEIIRRLKKHHPALKVYAAYDPYRHGFRQELDGVARKVDAGADGFFTQPIFDLRLLALCADMLQQHCVFWGIAPVLGDKSRAYWEKTNQIVFPPEFVPSLDWNRDFARRAIQLIRQLNANVYFMPIRVDLASYLSGLLDLNA
jgi:methylenetetrahydrofolate reductase (NADPH)